VLKTVIVFAVATTVVFSIMYAAALVFMGAHGWQHDRPFLLSLGLWILNTLVGLHVFSLQFGKLHELAERNRELTRSLSSWKENPEARRRVELAALTDTRRWRAAAHILVFSGLHFLQWNSVNGSLQPLSVVRAALNLL
jgi:hypothetical protein